MNVNVDKIPTAAVTISTNDNAKNIMPYLYRVHVNEGDKSEDVQ